MKTSPTHDKNHTVNATRPGLLAILGLIGFVGLFIFIMTQVKI